MEIIKPGRGFIAEVVCNGSGNNGEGCGAVLGVNREDMRYSAGGGFMDRDPAVTIRCCACGTLTDLPRKQWPTAADTLERYSAPWAAGIEPGER